MEGGAEGERRERRELGERRDERSGRRPRAPRPPPPLPGRQEWPPSRQGWRAGDGGGGGDAAARGGEPGGGKARSPERRTLCPQGSRDSRRTRQKGGAATLPNCQLPRAHSEPGGLRPWTGPWGSLCPSHLQTNRPLCIRCAKCCNKDCKNREEWERKEKWKRPEVVR